MTIPPGVIVSALVGLLVLVGGLITNLYVRMAHLEGRVTKLTDLSHRWWEWGQRVTVLYHTHRKAGSPDLPPIPTEED